MHAWMHITHIHTHITHTQHLWCPENRTALNQVREARIRSARQQGRGGPRLDPTGAARDLIAELTASDLPEARLTFARGFEPEFERTKSCARARSRSRVRDARRAYVARGDGVRANFRVIPRFSSSGFKTRGRARATSRLARDAFLGCLPSACRARSQFARPPPPASEDQRVSSAPLGPANGRDGGARHPRPDVPGEIR